MFDWVLGMPFQIPYLDHSETFLVSGKATENCVKP